MNKSFLIGKNNIGYINDNFKKWFRDMSFTPPRDFSISWQFSGALSSTENIVKKFAPQQCSLGEMFYILKKDKLSKDGKANLFFVKDKDDIIRVIDMCWVGSGYGLFAYSLEENVKYPTNSQIFSKNFSAFYDRLKDV